MATIKCRKVLAVIWGFLVGLIIFALIPSFNLHNVWLDIVVGVCWYAAILTVVFWDEIIGWVRHSFKPEHRKKE